MPSATALANLELYPDYVFGASQPQLYQWLKEDQPEKRISDLESQIADRREFYNDCVNTFNIRIQQVPDTFIAGLMHLAPRTMLKVDEADKVDVKMAFGAAN